MKLFLTTVVLAVTLLLLGSLAFLSAKDLHMTVQMYTSEQAYYLAEAGLVRAKQQYALDPAWRGTWTAVPLGEGTYTARIYDQAGKVQAESTGQVGAAKVKKTVVLQ